MTTSAALLQRFEHGADVEVLAEGGLDADLDVVEVDEYRDIDAFVWRQTLVPCRWLKRSAVTECHTAREWEPQQLVAIQRIQAAVALRTITEAGALHLMRAGST